VFDRATYRDDSEKDWTQIKDPVGMLKWDGANFFVPVEADGSLRFFSRRQSVKGGFPERTSQLPHLTQKKLPEFAGQVFNVELVHTGKTPFGKEAHGTLSGILNSKTEKSIATQAETGPVRMVLHNVVEPKLATLKDKLLHMKAFERAFGDRGLVRAVEPHLGHVAIHKLIADTKMKGQEGAIIASLSAPETANHRVKIKHKQHFNLVVARIEQEMDKHGSPKPSAGALVCNDRSGREVANVGTGLSHPLRKEIWENKSEWLGRAIQVETMGLAVGRLRSPVYNGEADGDVDLVS
jgi:hypothetical protein